MRRRVTKINFKPLDNEEKELMASLDRGEWKPVPNARRVLRDHAKIFRNARIKNQNINIRMTESDLDSYRAKAIAEGIPYQTLISSILHKYLSGKLTHSR